METTKIINNLLKSKDPSIQLKVYLRLLEYDYETPEVKKITASLHEKSVVVQGLLNALSVQHQLFETGRVGESRVYKKWEGIHWVLADLADIGYPPGDEKLLPSIQRELTWLLSEKRWGSKKMINGRRRFCASQEGNGLFSIISLGLAEHVWEECTELADRLITYQWKDGGWNCDVQPEAIHSSYHESAIPLRALNVFERTTNGQKAKKAVDKASELFLKRKLFKKMNTDKIIDRKWTKLSYPSYWMYKFFFGLKVIAECGKINDKRCEDALELLESKQLPEGGFPTEVRNYSRNKSSRYSPVDWGEVNKRKMNEWVTIDALYILKKANRIDIQI
ncbi:MAG: hypothetical protein JSV04_00395 [Candidatus Heimdallarchaeota archaeon]|nr:MAG: hypothetical protein JSV04_00395 [Candidatus Heimdallarchaeota archaeon]